MSEQSPVITIDGPSGTGKGTISQLVAKALDWNLLDSGALYRVLGLAARQHAVDIDNEEALVVLAAHLDVQFQASSVDSAARVILEGEDVTDAIRSEDCGNDASRIAALPAVRQALLQRQRAFAQAPGLVTDGRDMGTVVFPQAEVKIYLDASRQERAQRRFLQLKEKGINATLSQVLDDLSVRDERDQQRRVAPLKPATDAVYVDTTPLSIGEVVEKVLELARLRVSDLEEV